MNDKNFRSEVYNGERFEFEKNWKNFNKTIDSQSTAFSEASLLRMLKLKDMEGLWFIDIGSGSGLSSLAARNLRAEVVSFDYDEDSVECTEYLRKKFYSDDNGWKVIQGSVLDTKFMDGLGKFDIVYSWGVLHHTGKMWFAIDNTIKLVKPGGRLFISIYNDQSLKLHL